MTKIINWFKNINRKNLLVAICLILFQLFVFYATKPFLGEPGVLRTSLDDKIPFIPHFIWFYVSWYPMLLLVPYYIAKKNKTAFFKYGTVYVISLFIAAIFYLSMPKIVTRAVITGTDISSRLVQTIYNLDNPGLNCLPSIHCTVCFLFIFGILATKETTTALTKFILILHSTLIVTSTIFVKQHVLYDMLLALIIVGFTWIVSNRFKLYDLFEKYVYNRFKIKE